MPTITTIAKLRTLDSYAFCTTIWVKVSLGSRTASGLACIVALLEQSPGRDSRRFSQGDSRKDQKRPSGNSLFHDPDSFALAFGIEIDVYVNRLDSEKS